MSTIKDTIIHTLEKNKLTMIPKWKFLLYSILSIISLLFLFTLLVFVFSMILFVLAKHGFIYLPFFKLANIFVLLASLPFFLLFFALVVLVIIEMLVKKYSFGYRKPYVTIVLITTLFAAFVGFLVTLTPLHDQIHAFGKRNHILFITESYGRPRPVTMESGYTVLRGVLHNGATSTFDLTLPDDDTEIHVIATSTGAMHIVLPKDGEDIVVFGHFEGKEFDAEGFHATMHMGFSPF